LNLVITGNLVHTPGTLMEMAVRIHIAACGHFIIQGRNQYKCLSGGQSLFVLSEFTGRRTWKRMLFYSLFFFFFGETGI
jgi:hypothetical protein